MRGLADIFDVPELRKRVLFTLGAIAVFRIGASIPIPGVNGDAIRAIFDAQQSSLLGFLNTFSGGALARFSSFSRGVVPYINASIIMSLLQGAHVLPFLDRLAKDGELGRRKLNSYTRYLTLFLAVFQSFGLTIAITKMQAPGGMPTVIDPSWMFYCVTVLTMTAGTIFVMWLGEQITEQGIGNGVSLLIFTGIVESIPAAAYSLFELVRLEEINLFAALGIIAALAAVVVVVVWVETAQRKIPVQYAKRMVGRKMYGGSQSYLPLKVDQSGVIAVIFALSLLSVPVTVATFMPQDSPTSESLMRFFQGGNYIYDAVYAGLIIFFCYFYNSVSINPVDLAENMKKSGGFIPGIRPGRPTEQYINRVLIRITWGGAFFLGSVAVAP
ncbi:MAG: preprotein translocase subunit SecY, partial [Elusimicrobiota bacterium]|nr:preprotein translocase subunit SecY [Elusimicrobiota bacterium]